MEIREGECQPQLILTIDDFLIVRVPLRQHGLLIGPLAIIPSRSFPLFDWSSFGSVAGIISNQSQPGISTFSFLSNKEPCQD
jgi:hypothetical protein